MIAITNGSGGTLSLEKNIFNRNDFASLKVQTMAGRHGHVRADFVPFILRNDTLDNVEWDLDLIQHFAYGPIVVIIHKEVAKSLCSIMSYINNTCSGGTGYKGIVPGFNSSSI